MTPTDPAVEDSLADSDVVGRNAELFRLLRHQSVERVRAFVRDGVEHERRTVLAHRFRRYRQLAEATLQRVPPFAAAAPELAERWAAYRFARDSEAILLILELGGRADPGRVGEVLTVSGAEHLAGLDRFPGAPLFVSSHSEAYQALPVVLAALGHETAFLMDGAARGLAEQVYGRLAPDALARLTPVPAQSPAVGRTLIRHVAGGRPALMFPEFAFASTGYPQGEFFGRTVWTPPGAEAISRVAKAPVVPLRLEPAEGGHRLVVDEPLYLPGQRVERGEVTRAVFDWLRRTVAAAPHRWWCWEIFESLMAADREDAAARAS